MSSPHRKLFIAPALALAFSTVVAAQPTITGIQSPVLPRSGRVAIEGFDFGATPGEVLVADLPAWATTWTDDRVVAYVPEAAPLGLTTLRVVASGQPSNEVDLAVTTRAPSGKVRWTFEADSTSLWWRPALAPGGTIYIHANNRTDGLVYALSPDGALLWVQKVVWYPYVPPSAGPDGAVYVSSINRIYRISKSGQIEWEFSDPGAQGIHTAPTIGPDGKLYGASDGGLGAFALDPANGSVVWSNIGDPPLNDYGTAGTEMIFGPSQAGGPTDQLYLHMDGVGTSSIYAFSLDGTQNFAVGLAAIRFHEPAVGSDGALYAPRYTGLWVAAFEPSEGSTLWEYRVEGAAGSDDVEIGPDDTLYFVGGAGHLEAYDPHARERVWLNSSGMVLDRPTISPAGSVLVLTGVPDYGDPGFVKGFDPATGQELWTVDLPGDPYPQSRVLGTDHPRITPDGTTAYVSTFTVSDGSPPAAPVSFLYAIELEPTTIFRDGFESGTMSNWSLAIP